MLISIHSLQRITVYKYIEVVAYIIWISYSAFIIDIFYTSFMKIHRTEQILVFSYHLKCGLKY